MATLSQFAAIEGNKPAASNGPGSNGFWRRDIYRVPGTYTWTATKTGNILIEGLGAGAGGSGTWPGASNYWAIRSVSLAVTAGQTLTIVIGAGGAGAASGSAGGNGGSTSVSGTPIGGTPLTIAGATGANGAAGATGSVSGPWDLSFAGAVASAAAKGAPSSGSPFGIGKASAGGGGAGWGGGANSFGGASTHSAASTQDGARGLSARGGQSWASSNTAPHHGESSPYWALNSVDSGGGGYGISSGGPG